MDLGLEGRSAIVTGGAMGIGLAVVEALSGEGMRVAILDRDEGAGEAVAARLENVIFEACDLIDRARVKAATTGAIERLGGLDVLVNNAGIQEYGTVIDTPEDQWDRVLAVNLTGAFLVSKYCVPAIIDGGGGAVVNMASVQAFAAQKGVTAYAASKGGVVQLTRAMAMDFAPHVRVNCVCPGSVDTPMLRGSATIFSDDPDAAIQAWGRMHPMGRPASAAEVANTVAFLASPRASFTTGAAYFVDGGLLSMIGGTGE